MYFLLFLVTFAIIYIASFKSDFTQENIQKVAPIIAMITVIVFILAIFVSAMKH